MPEDVRHENTLLAIVREHNQLNGFRFVIGEFCLVAAAALFIAASGMVHSKWLTVLAGTGMAANALAVIVVTIGQIRAGETSQGLLKFRSAPFRAEIARKHSGLGAHTIILAVSILIPFLLLTGLAVQRRRHLSAVPACERLRAGVYRES